MTIDLSAMSKQYEFRQNNLSKIIYRRDEFFRALKKVYYDLNGDNLPIYGVVIYQFHYRNLAKHKT